MAVLSVCLSLLQSKAGTSLWLTDRIVIRHLTKVTLQSMILGEMARNCKLQSYCGRPLRAPVGSVAGFYAFLGKCICDHNTTGEHCERCLDGFYGLPATGTPDDCRPCPCPEESRCVELLSGEVACFDCPLNRTGKLCRFHLPCMFFR